MRWQTEKYLSKIRQPCCTLQEPFCQFPFSALPVILYLKLPGNGLFATDNFSFVIESPEF
ncbi:MAG: hypothetical protein IKD10_05110 [Lentisphaeria bacterium]|nr:hypothetical protein [Lentisphaeria bacterium]